MEEACKESRNTWIYWNKFKIIHFAQYLRNGYDRQLAIPEDFARNFKKKLAAETVTLKGPSGDTWSVGITEKDGKLCFINGWPEFVADHSLKENDLLFFKYDRDSYFDVLVFDGKGLCENPDSYFVRKHVPRDHTPVECQTKRRTTEASGERHFTSPHTGSDSRDEESPPPEKMARAGANNLSIGEPTFLPTPRRSIRRGGVSVRRRAKTRPDSDDSDDEEQCFDRSVTHHLRMRYASKRRHVTQDEIINTYQLAKAKSSPEDFVAIMKPTHVYKGFFLNITRAWVVEHLTFKNQDVTLRVKDRMWRVNFRIGKARDLQGGLSSGWMKFALENNLEEHDVCVFKVANTETKPAILDVTIYRVVDETVPLSHVLEGPK